MKLQKKILIVLLVTVSASVNSEAQDGRLALADPEAGTIEYFMDQARKDTVQESLDISAKKPNERKLRIATLATKVKNKSVTTFDRQQVVRDLLSLGRLRAMEVSKLLIENVEFSEFDDEADRRIDGMPSPLQEYPAVQSLVVLGKPALPEIVKEISSQAHSDIFIRNVFYAIKLILGGHREPTIALFADYANEYDQQANRLRTLAEQLPDMPPNVEINVKPITKPDQAVARLARIFELQDLIQDEKLTEKDEPKVLEAIGQLGQLSAVEAASTLADKLNWERPALPPTPVDRRLTDPYAENNTVTLPIDPGVMAADPKGLLSPKITEAAMKALLKIGTPALPVIIDATSQRYRELRFRDNASTLIVQLSGGKEAARAALLQAADEDDKKVKRLRELAASLLQTN